MEHDSASRNIASMLAIIGAVCLLLVLMVIYWPTTWTNDAVKLWLNRPMSEVKFGELLAMVFFMLVFTRR